MGNGQDRGQILNSEYWILSPATAEPAKKVARPPRIFLPPRRRSRLRTAACIALGLGLLGGCRTGRDWLGAIPADQRKRPEIVRMEVTAYCPCGECCNWRRNWLGRPVIASGPREGERKAVGITASGTEAAPGTIAADPKLYPFGTVMYIPGYGYGRVEDTGRDITGRRLDVYFTRHDRAEDWGRQPLEVRVWRP